MPVLTDPTVELKQEISISTLATELAYEYIKESELFDLISNSKVDAKAEQLGSEIEEFMEQWIEREVKEAT